MHREIELFRGPLLMTSFQELVWPLFPKIFNNSSRN